mmetsp:Transcript_19458/g.35960  ORF Transcript_19458/g.35960 Transcript_19458/m.35960 type:complete len:308 (-) Transcript_19458:1075-1998(-)
MTRRSQKTFRMELHCSKGQSRVLDRHDCAILELRRDHQVINLVQRCAVGIKRVIPSYVKGRGQTTKSAPLGVVVEFNLRRLAVHRVRKHIEFGPKVLCHALKTKAHPKHWDFHINEHRNCPGAVKICRLARTGAHDNKVRFHSGQLFSGDTKTNRGHGSPCLAKIVGQGMHKRILVVDQHHPLVCSSARPVGILPFWFRGRAAICSGVRALNCTAKGRSFQLGLSFFRGWVRVKEERGTSAYLANTVFKANCAQGEASIKSTVKTDQANGTTIPAPGTLLVALNELDGPRLGCTGYSNRPGVDKERI